MTQLYLSQPALVSSLGEGIEQHIQHLIRAQTSPLSQSNQVFAMHDLQGKAGFFGEFKGELRAFPADLPEQYHSRNNQLLWHSLAQIEPIIEQAIQRFGRERIAVVMGSSTTGGDENIPVFKSGAYENDWGRKAFNQAQQYFSAPADFIAHQYGLRGLTYGISTACTSGAKALMSAARLLKAGLCDAVICGGVDSLSPLTVSGFGSLSVMSDERTNPLSKNRKGINIGEGAAVFVLSRENFAESAIALLGYGASSDAYHMSSPHPEGEGAMSAFSNALNSAKLSPEQIGWINLHGTGTIHNDQMESLAVANIFGKTTPCTTTKPYTGHTLGAAGAIEAAILWGVINRQINPQGKLPAQLWDGEADQNLAPIQITDKQSQWQAGKRIAASSSFAFGGNNTVLILGEVDA
ncbi:beta-ketoacyl-[acyl-carrier-protein] synthase II [Pasteurellaceae bacterium RH1A]|nr:beta-ketoacyl-[acyl-carrier-protein] synthase II [Pasteurellaceae bacterium RH1A]